LLLPPLSLLLLLLLLSFLLHLPTQAHPYWLCKLCGSSPPTLVPFSFLSMLRRHTQQLLLLGRVVQPLHICLR